jgi:hypothetical protein
VSSLPSLTSALAAEVNPTLEMTAIRAAANAKLIFPIFLLLGFTCE